MSQSLVGLDIGHRTVRAVSLRRVRGALTVQAWAAVPRLAEDGSERTLEAVLADLKRRIDLGPAPVVALSTVASLVRYVSTVALPPDRLAKSLRLELLQNIEGATELAADTFTLPLPGDELRHCCILAQPQQVREALTSFTAARVPVGHLHYAPAALLNTSLPAPAVEGPQLCLVVDIGALTTSVGLFGEGRLLACRQLPSGGQHFTDTLANARGVNAALAETWKISGQLPAALAPITAEVPALVKKSTPLPAIAIEPAISLTLDNSDLIIETPSSPRTAVTGQGLFDDDPPAAAAPVASEPASTFAIDILFDDPPPTASSAPLAVPAAEKAFDPFASDPKDAPPLTPPGRHTIRMARVELGPEMTKAAEMLYAQLASSIAWFKTQLDMAELPIAMVQISGGGAGLTALDHYLSRRFGVPVKRLDPFLGIQGQAPDRPHEFATAVGLALAAPGGHKDAIRLELLPEGLLRQRLWATTLVWPFVAAAAVLLAGIVTGWTWWSEQDAAQTEKTRIDKFNRDHAGRMAQITQMRKERDDLSEDLRAIASRIYAARDLLFTVRALKEQTDQSKELWVTQLKTDNVGIDSSAATAGAVATNPDAGRSRPKNRSIDTAIERGGVVITGLVKFDAAKTDPEMNAFFDQWRQAILEWKPDPQSPRLFKDRRVTVFDVKHLKEGKSGKEGKVPFSVSYSYQATQLGQITVDAEKSDKSQSAEQPAPTVTPAPQVTP